MPRLTERQWEDIRAAWEAGEPMARLARDYGVSVETIKRHRVKEQWVVGALVASASSASSVPESAVSYEDAEIDGPDDEPDEWSPVPAAAETSDASALLKTKVAELEARLAEYEPVTVEWPVDRETAARLLAAEMDEMIQGRIESINIERLKRGRPTLDADGMDPRWVERQRDEIITETVEGLTKWASNEGMATRTLAMVKPDGTKVKVPLQDNIGNYGLNPAAFIGSLKAKGYKELLPRCCWRDNCWAGADEQWKGYCGELHYRLDPYIDAPQRAEMATTTVSFGSAG